MFDGKHKMQYKIRAVLDLVDAVWTPQERKRIAKHELSQEQAKEFFLSLAKKCKNCAYVIGAIADFENHKILPTKHIPNLQCGTQISGTYNCLGKFPLINYIPNWNDERYSTKAGTTLLDYCHLQQERLKRLITKNPAIVGKKKPRNARNR